MNKLTARMWLTQIANKCNFGVISEYHGSTLNGDTTLGIVIDNKDNAISIGAKLIMNCKPEEQSKLLIWLKDAYTDDIAEPGKCIDYRVIYFPALMEA